jgi:hypothetical protein
MKDDEIMRMINAEMDEIAEIKPPSQTSARKQIVRKAKDNLKSTKGDDNKIESVEQGLEPQDQSVLESILPTQNNEMEPKKKAVNSKTQKKASKAIPENSKSEEGISETQDARTLAKAKRVIRRQEQALKEQARDEAVLKDQLSRVQQELDDLRQSLEQESNVQEEFQLRGLMGRTESEQAIRALANSHQIAPLLGVLKVLDIQRFRKVLDEHLQLLSSQAPKELKNAMATIQVSGERCELTGGQELIDSQRKFLDGLVVNGFHDVLILGAPSRMLNPLRTFAVYHKIKFQLGPAVQLILSQNLKQLVGNVPLVLIWNPSSLPHNLNDVELTDTRVIYCDSSSLAAFMDFVGQTLLETESQ